MDQTSEEDGDVAGATDTYMLRAQDKPVLGTAVALLRKTIASPHLEPAQLVSVAKLLHVYTRLPRTSEDIEVTLMVKGPTRTFGTHRIYHVWNIGVMGQQLEVVGNGYFWRPETGGDSFTSFSWEAEPGWEPHYSDYLDTLGLVDDAQTFQQHVDGVDLSEAEYEFGVDDDANPLLGEEDQDV